MNFPELEEHVQLGISAFILGVVLLLLIFRLTRRRTSFRQKARIPLLLLFLLGILYDCFFLMDSKLPSWLSRYYFAALYLCLAVLLIRLTAWIFFGFLSRKMYRVPKLLEELARFALYTVASVSIIQYTLNIQLTTVLATSAIITVVLGLALQETLGNLFAGLALHMDPAYQVGDWIHAGENTGRVEEITWRATKLRTTNNDYVIIPNGSIAKERLTNLSFPRTPHASRLHISLAYSIPPNRVDRVMRALLAGIDNVAYDPPPEVRVMEYKDFSIDYQVKFFYKDFGLIEPTMAAIRKAIWYHFKRENLNIPFPIQNIYLHQREEERDYLARTAQRLADSLRKVDVFSELDNDERLLIANHLEELFFARNELIIKEGESGDSFFIIDEGEVDVFVNIPNGGRKVLSRLREGDFFGEIALLAGGVRTASVAAITDVRVHELKKEGFKQVLESKPQILDEIGTILTRRKDELVEIAGSIDTTAAQRMTNIEIKDRIIDRVRRYFGL